ncbi:MAG: ABC transporter permease subunit [Bdellovibrionales bacterium]|nr:ABC transporter permease subunit [Bdellovibrionales bacterium]
MAQYLEANDFVVERRFGLGGTMIAYEALKTNEIQIYPEYTGTLIQGVLKKSKQSVLQLSSLLKEDGIEDLAPFGFDNSYCVVMKESLANEKGIQTISDLSQHPTLRGAFSGEFQERKDGWPALKYLYQLNNPMTSIEIPLTYDALRNNKVDFAEAYTTEPLIAKYGFIVLADDKEFFPKYDALPIVNEKLSKKAKDLINQLGKTLSNPAMIKLNEMATQGISFPVIAESFLLDKKLIRADQKKSKVSYIDWAKMLESTKDHLVLTLLAVLLATILAVPLAAAISSRPRLAQPILTFAGLMQTIPSIALLSFMIPLVGIGFKPALLGLFIYSLLPIIRNTYTAMRSIDPKLITAARGIGLYPWEIFYSVKLPLSFPIILAGIRTATILNVGTATLAAFIGAGGLGEPIVTGLALNDTKIILEGAIPAAVLAIVIDFLFGGINSIFNRSL